MHRGLNGHRHHIHGYIALTFLLCQLNDRLIADIGVNCVCRKTVQASNGMAFDLAGVCMQGKTDRGDQKPPHASKHRNNAPIHLSSDPQERHTVPQGLSRIEKSCTFAKIRQ